MLFKKLSLVLIFLCASFLGFGQITTIDFETAGAGYSPSTTIGNGFQDVFNRTNTGLTNVTNEDGYYWAVEDLNITDPSIALDQIDVTGSDSFTFSIDMTSHYFDQWDSSDQMRIYYAIDGGTQQNLLWVESVDSDASATNAPAAIDTDFNGVGNCGSGTTLPSLSTGITSGCTVSSSNFSTFTTSSIALSGNTTLDIVIEFTGLTSGDEGIYLDNIIITETSSCTDTVDWCNIQIPNISPQTITVANSFDVYVQSYEPNVTDTAFNQGAGINAWIGYSTSFDPNTGSWTWIPANYNDTGGNNDEYTIDLGLAIPSPGTYYIASRFELNSCENYTYGGKEVFGIIIQLNLLLRQTK